MAVQQINTAGCRKISRSTIRQSYRGAPTLRLCSRKQSQPRSAPPLVIHGKSLHSSLYTLTHETLIPRCRCS
ncbi:hypothetical protein E2C01_034863 [Portunus trituberculatus]|uniref:Uncharacterized protein n=1 Tax=Portunus trituberculatus TaxID=210409 RepID=A0A5B7F6N4_PORTR|nr:hypothetical protein [Portunus trituberculatus]